MHAVVVVAFEVHTDIRAGIDDTLVDDGHYAHGIVHGIVGVLRQCHSACRYRHRALRHVHGAEADFRSVVAFIFSAKQEFVFLRYLPRHGFGGVVERVEAVFVGHRLVVQIIAQMASERFRYREIDASLADGESLHIVELAVRIGAVVGIQAIKVHDAKQLGVFICRFGQVRHIHACRIALVLDVQFELLLLCGGGPQAVDILDHQVPVTHLRRVRCIFQCLDKQCLGVVCQVR